MPNEAASQAIIRRLFDGEVQAALLSGLHGHTLRIELPPVSAGVSLNMGDLVEVTCPETMYLGVVRGRQDRTIIIGVEHALDRKTLASILQVWRRPAAQ
jgi:hypothetical protein